MNDSLSGKPCFLTETYLAHKSGGASDEDGFLLVESCNWTQTWGLVHLYISSLQFGNSSYDLRKVLKLLSFQGIIK